MAPLAKYGRKVSAPGPSGIWPGNVAIYDRGLAAWSDSLGEVANVLKAKDLEIKAARESTEIVGRSSEYGLELDAALTRSAKLTVDGRPATGEEMEGYFRQQAEELEKRYGDVKGLRPGAQADLQNNLTTKTAQRIGNLRALSRQRDMANIQDRLAIAKQEALQSGVESDYRSVLAAAREADVISAAIYDREVKEFPISAKLYGIRQQMDMLDQADVPVDVKLRGLQNLSQQLEELNQQDLSKDQKEAIAAYRADASGIGVQTARLRKMQGDALEHDAWLRALETEDGTAKPDRVIHPSDLTAMVGMGMDPAAAVAIRERLTNPNESAREQMLPSYDAIEQACEELADGRISEDQAVAVWRRENRNLSATDAKSFLGRIRKAPGTTLDKLRTDAATVVDEVLTTAFGVEKSMNPTAEELVRFRMAKGDAMKQINDWSAQHFSKDVAIDPRIFMEGSLRILDRVRKQYEDQQTIDQSQEGDPFAIAPKGYEEIWAHPKMTDELKQRFLMLSEPQRRIFLSTLRTEKAGRP
jgi:hypothetical protein